MHSEKKMFKKKKSFLPTYHNLFQAVTWTTHIFFIGLTINATKFSFRLFQNMILSLIEIQHNCDSF